MCYVGCIVDTDPDADDCVGDIARIEGHVEKVRDADDVHHREEHAAEDKRAGANVGHGDEHDEEDHEQNQGEVSGELSRNFFLHLPRRIDEAVGKCCVGQVCSLQDFVNCLGVNSIESLQTFQQSCYSSVGHPVILKTLLKILLKILLRFN